MTGNRITKPKFGSLQDFRTLAAEYPEVAPGPVRSTVEEKIKLGQLRSEGRRKEGRERHPEEAQAQNTTKPYVIHLADKAELKPLYQKRSLGPPANGEEEAQEASAGLVMCL